MLDTGTPDEAWDKFKVASYSQPAVSVRPIKLRRGRKFGRGRGRVKRGEDTEDVEDLDISDDGDEEGRVIEERSAVYPQQQAGSAYQRLGPYSFHSSYYGSQDKTPPPPPPPPQPVCEVTNTRRRDVDTVFSIPVPAHPAVQPGAQGGVPPGAEAECQGGEV